jgi:hypothetical protein
MEPPFDDYPAFLEAVEYLTVLAFILNAYYLKFS